MFVEAALCQQNADDERLDRDADHTASAQPIHHQPQYCRHADQHDQSDDAALAPAPLAPTRAIELAVEKGNRASGQHDRMRDVGEHGRHVADSASIAMPASSSNSRLS